MADAFIHYHCGCNQRGHVIDSPLYLCHKCAKLKCTECTTQEIDSFFCPQCMENMSSSEVTHFRNSCKKCFECPSCFSILSYHVQADISGKSDIDSDPDGGKGEEDKALVYLRCGYCRWNSLDIGLHGNTTNDLIALSMDKDKFPSDYNVRAANAPKDAIGSLIEKHQREDRDKAKEKRHNQARKKLIFNPRLDTLPERSNTAWNWTDVEKSLKDRSEKKHDEPREEYTEEDEVLNAMRGDSYDASNVTTLEQRITHPSIQTRDSRKLIPMRKALISRRSKRCGECEQILIKPDLNPVKIEFKRQWTALQYVPKSTTVCDLHLRMTNPLLSISMLELDAADTSTSDLVVSGLPLKTFLLPKEHEEEDDSDEIKSMRESDTKNVLNRKENTIQIVIRLSTRGGQPLKLKQKLGPKEEELEIPANHSTSPPPQLSHLLKR
ncbi:hypothetical protein PROFUN_00621 [Planoprotostelium fungivorum]|uniref:Dynactin subunit 4 n=1 Tax=Planoprotostelium fungivorum TaxID=1890364 RepID=A0A2P6NU08_9EUKA|nr:hypothetical protein PROFUN_00621 [Planoprotostelium fungivorum]